MKTKIRYDGVSSDDLSITVEGFSAPLIPSRDVEAVDVPGRNGQLLIDHGAYKNYEQAYTCHWRIDNQRDFQPRWWNGDSINSRLQWWLGKAGYCRLEDNLYPEHYRLAYCTAGVDLENRMNVLARGAITFNCKPQWYRYDGDQEIAFMMGVGGTITNPTRNNAYPLIRATCSDKCTITINGVSIIVDGDAAFDDGVSENGFLIVEIDCEQQNVVTQSGGENRNKYITVAADFPALAPGENTISFDGAMGYCGITPRWWDLMP